MKDKFESALCEELKKRWDLPRYSIVATRMTPQELAKKLTNGFEDESSDKNGEAVQATLKALGIKDTYKAIKSYLHQG